MLNKKRILIFSLAYYPLVGGAEVSIKEITDRISDIEFDMITLKFENSWLEEERIGNVNVYRVGSGASYINKILFVPRAALKAWSLNKRKKYHMFWSMMTYMVFPVSLMRLFGNRTPYLITLQDGDPFEQVFDRYRIRIFKPLLKLGFKNAAMVQTISNFLADWTLKLGYKGKVVVVPNGVEVGLFSKDFSPTELESARTRIGKAEGDIILASSSRLVEKNGLDDVVRALKLLPENIKFFNWGIGPDKDKLEKLVADLGVQSRVKLYKHDPLELPLNFRVSDIFIRPSLSEGQGISFLEGMASGLPVIATRVGGIPDFLFDPATSDHPTGLFVGVRNPEDIASQVTNLLASADLRKNIAHNAMELVREKYDWIYIVERIKKEVFDQVLNDR